MTNNELVAEAESTLELQDPQEHPKMAAVQTLPKDVSRIGQEIKLFGKWETQEYASIYPRRNLSLIIAAVSRSRTSR